MTEKDYRVVGLTVSKKVNHILFSRSSTSLCGEQIGDQDIRILNDFEGVEDSDGDLCEECVSLYEQWVSDNGERAPTVKCRCDVRTNLSDSETCGSIVSAFEARELCHPTADRDTVPVCPNCYRWIRSIDANSVETSYEEADPWLEKSQRSKHGSPL